MSSPGPYIIETTYLVSQSIVPTHLANYITASEYSSICYAVERNTESAICASCCCEVAVCVFTGFFCIFCIHPCLQDFLVSNSLPRKLNELNDNLYAGLPVLSHAGHGKVGFNTAVLARHGRGIPGHQVPVADGEYALDPVPVHTDVVIVEQVVSSGAPYATAEATRV